MDFKSWSYDQLEKHKDIMLNLVSLIKIIINTFEKQLYSRVPDDISDISDDSAGEFMFEPNNPEVLVRGLQEECGDLVDDDIKSIIMYYRSSDKTVELTRKYYDMGQIKLYEYKYQLKKIHKSMHKLYDYVFSRGVSTFGSVDEMYSAIKNNECKKYDLNRCLVMDNQWVPVTVTFSDTNEVYTGTIMASVKYNRILTTDYGWCIFQRDSNGVHEHDIELPVMFLPGCKVMYNDKVVTTKGINEPLEFPDREYLVLPQ